MKSVRNKTNLNFMVAKSFSLANIVSTELKTLNNIGKHGRMFLRFLLFISVYYCNFSILKVQIRTHAV
jgi:hypothetical protein